jgi:hypothetical protein
MYIEIRKEKIGKKMNVIPLFVLMALGGMALYNGLTSTCSISKLLEDYLN